VLTEAGPVEVSVPRDRDAGFEPKIVAKRQRRDGQVANRPVYLALGVTVDGERDILGLWAGEHGDGEGAKFWLRVLSEIKNRGARLRRAVKARGRFLASRPPSSARTSR